MCLPQKYKQILDCNHFIRRNLSNTTRKSNDFTDNLCSAVCIVHSALSSEPLNRFALWVCACLRMDQNERNQRGWHGWSSSHWGILAKLTKRFSFFVFFLKLWSWAWKWNELRGKKIMHVSERVSITWKFIGIWNEFFSRSQRWICWCVGYFLFHMSVFMRVFGFCVCMLHNLTQRGYRCE